MKKIFLVIITAMAIFLITAMYYLLTTEKEFSYKDEAFSYDGRWYDDGEGVHSGWNGSWIRFKFSGSSLALKLNVLEKGSKVAVIIDEKYPNSELDEGYLITLNDLGEQIITVAENLEDKTHSVIVRLYGPAVDTMNDLPVMGYPYAKFTGIVLDESSKISKWEQNGENHISFVGDSYSSRYNQFSLFIDSEKYKVYPMGIPGQMATASDASARYTYPYHYKDDIPHNDPKLNGVVISYGTNDVSQGVSAESFKEGMSDLISKVRKDQPDAHIFLVQMLKNKEYDFSIYGKVLKELEKENPKFVTFIPTNEIWSNVTWESDMVHPDTDGMRVLADHIESYLDKKY